jgi:glycosyltransferase involved in cell wall biosynthesis
MKACILIPAFNAGKTLGPVVDECLSHGIPVIVVDDGSTDNTASILPTQNITLLRHKFNQGKGSALRTGFEWAMLHGFDAVITLDADGQHDASAVPTLIRAAETGETDLMIASRLTQFEEMSGLRKFWNRFGVWCMRQRTGFDITDSQSGFRFYSVRLLQGINLKCTGYNMEMEILMKAWKSGYSIGSTPIAARVADGRSTSHYRPFKDTWAICMTFLRYML